MPETSDLPYRAFNSRRTVKKRSRRYDDDNDIGLPAMHIPELPADDERKPRKLPWYQLNWQSYTRSGNPAVIFWLTLMFFALIVTEDVGPMTMSADSRILNEGDRSREVRILFETKFVHKVRGKRFSCNLFPLPKERQTPRDFGGLEFQPRSEFSDPIPIQCDFEHQRQEFLEAIDGSDDEYQPESNKENENVACPKVSWAAYTFPTCNQIHETPVERYQDAGYDVSYLNSGSYRDAFRFQRQTPPDHFVMKRMLASRSVGAKVISRIHKEAIILERLSSSPRILDIYSYCGGSVFVEQMASDLHTKIVYGNGVDSQERLDTLDNVYPQNNLTASEKLQISLEMAKSLADIHGFEGGPIVHADTHIEQWLIAPDGNIKLNDFNNAREPMWNKNKTRYCTSKASYGGTYRSPEEFSGKPQDESKDTFAFGNNIYTMITGLWPFYDDEFRKVSHDKTREDIIAGRRPFIDDRYRYRSRSFIELKLIDIMERCWAQERKDRPSIFEVVSLLQAIKHEAAKRGELHASSLINIPIPSA